MATITGIRPRALVRASGGPRYAVALAVDALGTGLLRPFLLLYGLTVLRLSAPVTGTAMTVGIVAGLVCMPAVGRWLDRGARSTVVAASMLVRVLGVVLLLAAPAGHVRLFATAALFLGIGNQAWPAAHAALVATVAHGRERDTALAGARALRNAALGVGALLATACLAGGTTALRALAGVTALAYLAAAALAWSVHVQAHPADAAPAGRDREHDLGGHVRQFRAWPARAPLAGRALYSATPFRTGACNQDPGAQAQPRFRHAACPPPTNRAGCGRTRPDLSLGAGSC